MRVFTRQEEERNISQCGGTCANMHECAMIKDFGFKTRGTAFVNEKCVLCCRKEVTNRFYHLLLCAKSEGIFTEIYNPYMVCDTDYPPNVFIDYEDPNTFRGITGPFVRYDVKDYRKVSTNCLIQTFPETKVSNWYAILINLSSSNFIKSSANPWFIASCPNDNCKLDILTIVGQYKSIGINNAVYDLETKCTKCNKCGSRVLYTYADQSLRMTLLQHNDCFYTKCIYCDVIIRYNKLRTAQLCEHCYTSMQERGYQKTKVCERCGVAVSLNRRGGTKYMDKGSGKTLYFCKSHKQK
jgi:hypothetical protein